MHSPRHILIMGLISSPIFFLYIYMYSIQSSFSLNQSFLLVAPHTIVLLFFMISNWYICVATHLHMKNLTNLVIRHVAGAVSITVIWLLIGRIYTELLISFTDTEIWVTQYNKSIPLFIVTAIVFYIIVANINYIIITFEKSRKAEEKALQNSLLARESELQSLKSTIHPHFLFNSLTALSSLTLDDPQSAHQLTNRISEFLRYTLRFYKKEKVSVKEELNHLKNYLEIEKIRLADRLKIELVYDENLNDLHVMPMILMPLAENAIKHGISNLVDGGTLKIIINKSEKYLHFRISNPYEATGKDADGEKKGLSVLQDRLKTFYLDNARLNIEKHSQEFVINLSIPVHNEIS